MRLAILIFFIFSCLGGLVASAPVPSVAGLGGKLFLANKASTLFVSGLTSVLDKKNISFDITGSDKKCKLKIKLSRTGFPAGPQRSAGVEVYQVDTEGNYKDYAVYSFPSKDKLDAYKKEHPESVHHMRGQGEDKGKVYVLGDGPKLDI